MVRLIDAIKIPLLFLVFLIGCGPAGKMKLKFVTIGTGGITGVYYPTGGAICKIINLKKSEYNIRCTFESTGGSVFNINAVLAGDLEFGIAQSDRQYQAVNGLADWKSKGPQNELRSVFSIHSELITLCASSKANINSVGDLKGKRVNLGNPGSGHRQNAIDTLSALGLDYKKDIISESIKASEAPGLLQDGRLDAFFYTVGHPSGAIKEATAGRIKVKIVPITGVEKLINRYPFYAESFIPIKLYPKALNKKDVKTFGVKATLVTSSKVPEEIVYAVTREVFTNLGKFKKLHPAYSTLTKKDMLKGLSAPIHSGALKYYKEAGLK